MRPATWLPRRASAMLGVLSTWLVASAHVGTLTAIYAGRAGPYDVNVVVRPQGVVPGQADVRVHVAQPGVRRVLVRAALAALGTEGAPAPDEMEPVRGEAGTFAARVWLMTGGSYGVYLTLEGEAGTASVVVPVVSEATQRLDMGRGEGAVLALLGGILCVGLVGILGAAAREAALPPGEQPDSRHRRSSRRTMGVGAMVLALTLVGFKAWWGGVDRDYVRRLSRPLHATATLSEGPGGAQLMRIALDDSIWSNPSVPPIVPDHGKPMHLFLVRAPAADVFAHLHPTPRGAGSTTFDATVEALPAGRYTAYAEVVQADGLARTITTTLDVPVPRQAASTPSGLAAWSRDDDSWIAASTVATPGGRVRLDDGTWMSWEAPASSVSVGASAPLRFRVRDSAGLAVRLDPYLGMDGHAVVRREDGGVFVHLHPMGTVSTAAMQRLAEGELAHAAHPSAPASGDSGEVTFPFVFPQPGRYRVWVQVKRGGRVQTGTFETTAGERR